MAITIPASDVTRIISVKACNTGSTETGFPAAYFLSPVLPGHEVYSALIYAYLLEHPSGRRFLFDLWLRRNQESLSPVIQNLIKSWDDHGFRGVVLEKDIVEHLESGGLKPADIDTIFWSHTHLDHIGDLSLFPATAELMGGHGSDMKGFRSDVSDSARAALQDLDEKIARAKALLDDLLSAREQAQLHLADVKSILHPLRSIANEPLLEIFSHCIPRVEYSSDTDALHPR